MTGSERPSPAVLGGENSGKALEPSNALKNYRAWGIPAVPSRGILGKALRAFPGSFRNFSRNFLRKVPAVLGVWPIFCARGLLLPKCVNFRSR